MPPQQLKVRRRWEMGSVLLKGHGDTISLLNSACNHFWIATIYRAPKCVRHWVGIISNSHNNSTKYYFYFYRWKQTNEQKTWGCDLPKAIQSNRGQVGIFTQVSQPGNFEFFYFITLLPSISNTVDISQPPSPPAQSSVYLRWLFRNLT